MIHFRNPKLINFINRFPRKLGITLASVSGFSLIEIMIAIIMLGMLMTAILNLQNSSFGSIISSSSKLTHILDLRNSFVTAAFGRAQEREQENTKKISAPEPTPETAFSTDAINEQSSLKKFSNTFIEKAQTQWRKGIITLQEKMITFLYKKPEKKEQEQK